MRLFRHLLVALAFLAGAALPALAQSQYPLPFVNGPQDVSQLNNLLNSAIIRPLDLFLQGLFPYVPSSVNNVVLTGAITGGVPTLGTGGSSSDTNVSLAINPKGNGNIILFNAATDTGKLQIANAASWYPAKGLTACPGTPASAGLVGGLGPTNVVKGYYGTLNYLAQPVYLVAC